MAKQLLSLSDQYELLFIFANTGEEWEETLRFANLCDLSWGLKLVWVEAAVHSGERRGTTHTVVNFETASRHGEPFEAVIKKYGIPNLAFPHCTRELKLNPMRSYLREIGWREYLTAVGIRKDEPKRVRKDSESAGIIYPLVSMFPTEKSQVNDWWEEQPFTLSLSEHQGNCKWCWKKSFRKHMMIVRETPQVYSFPARMESAYGFCGSNKDGNTRTFFRGRRSVKDIFLMSDLLGSPLQKERPDEDSGCSESCEAYGLETDLLAG